MAQINTLLCNKDFLGTGLNPCEFIQKKEWYSFIKVPSGWSLSISELEGLTKAEVIALVQQTTFDLFYNATAFTDNTADPTNEDFSSGISLTVRNGLPMLQFEFRHGIAFQSAASSKNTSMQGGVILIDRDNNIYGTWNNDETEFSGFTLSMFNTQTYRPTTGDTGARTLIDMQLANEVEINRRMAVITADSLGFNIVKDIKPIVSTYVVINSASVANGINVTINGLGNRGYGMPGITVDNIRVVDMTDNTVESIDTVSTGIEVGNYTITFDPDLTLGHQVKVVLWDATATPPVATALLADDVTLLKGESKPFTVTA